jgi:demethylmenaquinone methyltransferase/2-methoxy-6-polyprenyl-1,4-benzoquinol methylase
MNDQPREPYPPIRELTPEEHISVVRKVFSRVPSGYDFLNRVLSLRRDVAWRKVLVRRIREAGAAHLLDIATGTGDVAVMACKAVSGLKVTGVDFVPEMVLGARPKLAQAGVGRRVSLALADASRLPFPSESFDAASIAFGIRNMPHRVEVLREIRRTLKLGGSLFILEMVPPNNFLYRWYLTSLLPTIARWFTQDPPAYRYLADSILNFPKPEAFLKEMDEAGFSNLSHKSLTLGITYLFSGDKPSRMENT